MANTTGTFTLSSTGTGKTFSIGLQPTSLRFRVASKSSSSSVIQLSLGAVDSAGNQNVVTTYGDSTSFQSTTSSTKCISHYERISGVLTEVLTATFNSYTATGFKLDVTAASPSYQVFLEASN